MRVGKEEEKNTLLKELTESFQFAELYLNIIL